MITSPSFPPAVEGNATASASYTGDNVITAEPIDMAGLLAGAHHPGAGALVLFSGEVRNRNNDRPVVFLEYESHRPLAIQMIAEILATAREKWELEVAIAQHRVGKAAIGETAVVVITASAHRNEAYTANRYIIDRIKHEVPIWKCEYYTDGTREWGTNDNLALGEAPIAGR